MFWWNPSREKVWYVFVRMKCAWLNHLACEALLQQKLAQAQNKPEEDITLPFQIGRASMAGNNDLTAVAVFCDAFAGVARSQRKTTMLHLHRQWTELRGQSNWDIGHNLFVLHGSSKTKSISKHKVYYHVLTVATFRRLSSIIIPDDRKARIHCSADGGKI